MALDFEGALQAKLNEIVSRVQQEEARLKAEWQELELKKAQLEEERAAFEAEKEMIAAANNVVKSKVKLDVGGVAYHASRTTLTSTPGSMLEAMFSGRHVLEKDEDGRVFIDRDGATFKLVLEYLRCPALFSLDGLSEREVASCRAEFDYYGLPRPAPPVPPLCLRANTSPTFTRAQLQGDTCVIIAPGCSWEESWAIGAEVLADDAAWKLHIRQCSPDLVMGVIAKPHTSEDSASSDDTFSGWSVDSDLFLAGGTEESSPGWPGWQENDEAIFKLNVAACRLTVHLKRTGQCYTSHLTSGKAGQWRFCVETFEPAEVVLSAPTDEEHALVQPRKRQRTSWGSRS